MRNRIRKLIKNPWDRSMSIGCSGDELRSHLEKQFKQNISWQNYGTIWHVDHIKPLSMFDLLNPQKRARANHYTNLQPMLAADNLKKRNHYPYVQSI